MEEGFARLIAPDPHLTFVIALHEFQEFPMDALTATRSELCTVQKQVSGWYFVQTFLVNYFSGCLLAVPLLDFIFQLFFNCLPQPWCTELYQSYLAIEKMNTPEIPLTYQMDHKQTLSIGITNYTIGPISSLIK